MFLSLESMLCACIELQARCNQQIRSHLYLRHIDLRASGRTQCFLLDFSINDLLEAEDVGAVFDCAAEFPGISLNDWIAQGLLWTNLIIVVLMQFRYLPVTLPADSPEISMQSRLSDIDREYYGTLWSEYVLATTDRLYASRKYPIRCSFSSLLFPCFL